MSLSDGTTPLLKEKFPAGPGEATENQFTFASGGWGSPRPPLTEIQDRRATVTDALHTVNNIQVILVCCRPGDRGGGTETPAASVPRQYSVFSNFPATVTVSPSGPPGLFKGVTTPRHKVQARHARYSEMRNP